MLKFHRSRSSGLPYWCLFKTNKSNLLHSHSICLEWIEETSLFQIQPVHLWTASEDKNASIGDTSGQRERNNSDLHTLSPGTHKVEVAGGVVVGNVSSKLGNAGLVVVSVLGVELHVAVAEQKYQLHSKEEVSG